MTDLEISRALALVIGWEADQITEHMGFLYVADWPRKDNRQSMLHGGFYHPPMLPWQKFDYRDWAVAGPIAEQYGLLVDFKTNVAWFGNKSVGQRGGIPQKAIALAVIEGAKK